MGGGQQSSTVKNVTEVDPVTQAWRSNLMNAGASLYNQGSPAYYPGNTVVPFADATQSGLNYLQGYASQGAPNMGAANDAAGRALSGWNPAMPGAANAAWGGLNNQMAQPLESFANQNGVNPALDSLWQQGSQQIANQVNGNFAQAGRYGANAAHTGALTQGLGNLWGQVYAPAYESERSRQLQGATSLAGVGSDNANRRLQGTELMGSMWSQGNQDAARQQALLPSLYSYGMQPGQTMLDVGGIYEGQAQNYLNADQQRYDYTANAPWQYLQQYGQLMSGLPDFSNSTQTTTQPGPNRLMQGLGAAASIGSLFSGGLFGGSLFGGSDRRLKRDAHPIGRDMRGNKWWSFRYLWDELGKKRIGVMADEAPPHAVHMHPSGYAVVNYGAL